MKTGYYENLAVQPQKSFRSRQSVPQVANKQITMLRDLPEANFRERERERAPRSLWGLIQLPGRRLATKTLRFPRPWENPIKETLADKPVVSARR